jgi:decaprenylphospho-beta-D-erythro-pentofuranosid-2-ulose 2-reductase
MVDTLLILGGRSEIGLATAREFARNGFDIILASRNSQRLKFEKSDLEIRHGINVHLAEFDAERPEVHPEFYRNLPVPVDVVLYSAGYLGDQSVAGTGFHEADRIISVNYRGAVSILSLVADDFEARKAGVIIGIGSVAGDRGRKSNYIYGSAKAGFATFLAGLRHRLDNSGVRVVTIKPGFVDTRMTSSLTLPTMLTAQPSQLAAAIFRSYRSNRHTVYYLPVWRMIMFAIRNIPERIFVKTKM